MYMLSCLWYRAMEWFHGLESDWATSLYIGKMSADASLWGWIVLSFILALLLLCVIPKPFSRLLDKISVYLFPLAILVWLMGIGVYAIGFYNPSLTGWAVLPRAILASFRMFLVNNELARVSKLLQESNHYMICFAWTHFVAATISFLFVIRLIGFRFWAWVNLCVKSWFTHKSVYLFWGVNDSALLLAESIRAQKSKAENQALIAFVNTNDINDKEPNAQVGMMKIVDLISLRNKDEDRILNIKNSILTNCHRELSAVSGDSLNEMFNALRLKCLKRILRKATNIRIFLLSDDEEKNILSAVKLRDLFATSQEHPETVTLYAHARRNAKNEIYNHYSLYVAGCGKDLDESGKKVRIKLVDSSNLAVTSLKQQIEHHPVRFVEVDSEQAVVKSPFNALIIGFGEVGRDAFRFLYEFGAFVGEDGNRSPFHCYAIDANMHQIEGGYRLSTSGIVDTHLTLIDTAIGTERYCSVLQAIIETLNYVVITINDDDLAMATAVRLYLQAIQARGNQLAKFRIYVHCREKSHWKRMRDVAAKYNSCNALSGGQIVIFGDPKELYTYDLIVNDTIEKEAMRYHQLYEKTAPIFPCKQDLQEGKSEELLREEKNAKDVVELWDETFGAKAIKLFGKALERCAKCEQQDCRDKPQACMLSKIQEAIRMREQNIANSLHKATKAYLLLGEKCNDRGELQRWVNIVKSRAVGKICYQVEDSKQQVKLDNMARCEHIRWEASHQLMGYKYARHKDVVRKHFPAMRPWEALDDLTKSYDYNVVDTSIELLLEDAKNPQPKA